MGRRSLIQIAVEIVLAVFTTLLGPFSALLAAAVALGVFKNTSFYVGYYPRYPDYYYATIEDLSDSDLRQKVYLATGLAISVTGLGVVTEALLTCFRFPAIFNHQMNKAFRFVDITISFVLAGGHIVSGIILILYSKENEWDINCYECEDQVRFYAKFIRGSMISSAALCFIAAALFLVLGMFMIILDWKRNTTGQTQESAIHSAASNVATQY